MPCCSQFLPIPSVLPLPVLVTHHVFDEGAKRELRVRVPLCVVCQALFVRNGTRWPESMRDLLLFPSPVFFFGWATNTNSCEQGKTPRRGAEYPWKYDEARCRLGWVQRSEPQVRFSLERPMKKQSALQEVLCRLQRRKRRADLSCLRMYAINYLVKEKITASVKASAAAGVAAESACVAWPTNSYKVPVDNIAAGHTKIPGQGKAS